jgi:16S rRNA (adenine1518-N6/adenine1519-N6)-dimethyltransferase
MKVKAKKHLGQHFLKDEFCAKRIVDAYLEKKKNKMLLEIGPGTGVLTKYILGESHEDFLAFDVDKESIEFLNTNFPKHQGQFIEKDFLSADLISLCGKSFDIIGNFPYNISSQIMFRVWDYRNNIDVVVGMFQKEVAQRIASKPGTKDYGILSVLLQAFFDIEYLFTVQPGAFQPPPKVKSGVIRLIRNKTQQLNCDEELFKKVVKTAFNQRRKTLRNALKQMNEKKIDHPLLDKRAEQLGVYNFIEITRLLQY